jgi:hypothetical protein
MKKIKEIALNLNLELNKSFCRILLPKNFDLNKAVIQCYPKWKSKKRRHKLMILLSTIYLEPVPFTRILERTLNRGGLGPANIARISWMKGVLVEICRYRSDMARYLDMGIRTAVRCIQ